MPESPRVVLCVDDDADDREMVSNTIFEILTHHLKLYMLKTA